MKSGCMALISLCLWSCLSSPVQAGDDAALSGGEFTTFDFGRAAYATMASTVPAELREEFTQGRSVFAHPWLTRPAEDERFDGLGPLFNRLSCAACHPRNSAGFAPDHPGETMRTMLVRLSVPGVDAHGGPRPDPMYGDQLNENGAYGVPGEGRAELIWHHRREILTGGQAVELRWPTIRFAELAYGPLSPQVMTSARIAPPIYGLGLLEAVAEADILALADPEDGNHDGISGRANWVWDVGNGRVRLGRFGWKANQPTVHQQIAAAMIGDLGVTSPLYPRQNCAERQDICRAVPDDGQLELTAGQLHAVQTYHLGLGVPARRGVNDPAVQAGENAFHQAGCGGCHLPTLKTTAHPAMDQLGGQTIHPYTDLLLHDMGDGLADHRPDFLADGREWRTAPLWGLGLRRMVNDQVGYLHDGRARTVLEAVLWHGGEAQATADRVRAMTPEQRADLLRFLDSL